MPSASRFHRLLAWWTLHHDQNVGKHPGNTDHTSYSWGVCYWPPLTTTTECLLSTLSRFSLVLNWLQQSWEGSSASPAVLVYIASDVIWTTGVCILIFKSRIFRIMRQTWGECIHYQGTRETFTPVGSTSSGLFTSTQHFSHVDTEVLLLVSLGFEKTVNTTPEIQSLPFNMLCTLMWHNFCLSRVPDSLFWAVALTAGVILIWAVSRCGRVHSSHLDIISDPLHWFVKRAMWADDLASSPGSDALNLFPNSRHSSFSLHLHTN